jgi:uncharacterized protein YaiE (UPF0345 family)
MALSLGTAQPAAAATHRVSRTPPPSTATPLTREDLPMSTFENVTLDTTANVYFDGQCVSHTFFLADGTKKSAGVIFPSQLTFGTAAPEVMEIEAGACTVTLDGETATYSTGQSFSVPGDSSFDIEVTETVSYVCHYG